MNWLKRKYFNYQANKYFRKWQVAFLLGNDNRFEYIRKYKEYLVRCSLCS